MEHFLIFTSRYKDQDQYITRRIVNHLQARGKKVTTIIKEADWKSVEGEESEEAQNIPGDVDCMLVIGGDGTVLQAARETKKLHIPMIGINLGTLGYMTEIEPGNLENSLDKLLKGEYQTESRMMLNGKVCLKDGKLQEGWALNDIVISKSGSFQIIQFNIYVNGQFLHDYKADGMIITTPTGSTGYNLSAGGPLIEPKARLITLTPICPHSLNQRSIILSPDDVVEVVIPSVRDGQIQTVEANFDGTHKIPLTTGERIRIAQSDKTTDFLKINQVSFLEVLGKKMKEL